MADCIDTFDIEWDKWDVYKESDTSYKYIHNPDSFCGEDSREKIVVTFKDGKYEFDAQNYFEIYGSGGWNKWTHYSDEVKDAVLKDAMERIGKK